MTKKPGFLSKLKNAYLYYAASNGGDFVSAPHPKSGKLMGVALHLNSGADNASIEIRAGVSTTNYITLCTYNIPNGQADSYQWCTTGVGNSFNEGDLIMAYVNDVVIDNPIFTVYIQFD